jgi:acylphosphatase
MKQAAILTIHGRVQGVGFRYFVKLKADSLGINGFVRNHPNGIVYVEAEAEPEKLELFIQFCRQGPSHAWVEKIDIQKCPVQGFEGFEKK